MGDTLWRNTMIEVIDQEMRAAIDPNARILRYWIEHGTYPADEIAARFHHRLGQIHPYPNGNGRHARLATNLLLKALGQEPFTWGSASLIDPGDTRKAYVAALQAADQHDIAPLLAFVRS